MFIYALLLLVLFFLIVIWLGLDIYNNTKILDLPNGFFFKSFYFIMFAIVVFTIINISIAVYTYLVTKNKVGSTGNKGINGLKGIKGNDGKCNSECGTKMCYSDTVNFLNNYIRQKKNNKNFKIQNRFFLNHINKICHSKEYQNILNKDSSDKPSEKKLIDYIKNTSKIWIEEILKFSDGVKFLETIDETDNYWDLKGDISPFDEIKKYDLWNLPLPKTNKVLIRKQCLKDSDLPEADDPPLSIKKSNNYVPIYNSTKNHDEWGPYNCPYYQLGYKNRNTRNVGWCWFSKWAPKWGEHTWRVKKRTNANKPITIYNPLEYTDPEGKKGREKYYPLGSVWDDSYKLFKKRTDKCTPETPKNCPGKNKHYNLGPNKETLLVSGDVQKPVRFRKIWNSREGCKDCQPSYNNVTIWEPIAPKGYTCLGDVVTKGSSEPSKNMIRCIPNKCVEKKPLGKKVWNSEGFSERKFTNRNNELRNSNSGPIKKPKLVSLFSAGHSLENNMNLNKDDIGGYNLFRANQGDSYPLSFKSNGHSYQIKEECYIKNKVKSPVLKTKNIDILGYPDRDEKYSFDSYTNKSNLGIITQQVNNGEENKKLYIKHTGSKKSNEYFIKAYSQKNNNFEDCYTINDNDINSLSECNKKNPNQIFKLVSLKDKNNKNIKDKEFNRPLIKIKSKKTDKCFSYNLDENGIGKAEQTNCDGISGKHIWNFKSVSGDILP